MLRSCVNVFMLSLSSVVSWSSSWKLTSCYELAHEEHRALGIGDALARYAFGMDEERDKAKRFCVLKSM